MSCNNQGDCEGEGCFIPITQEEYNELIKDQMLLRALDYAGVDNWEGYSHALEMYYESLPEELRD